MKGAINYKGLKNLNTATTKRIRSRPPVQSTSYLDMYLLGKDKDLVDQQLAHLEERRERLRKRLKGILEELEKFRQKAGQQDAAAISDATGIDAAANPLAKPLPKSAKPRWKTMPLEY